MHLLCADQRKSFGSCGFQDLIQDLRLQQQSTCPLSHWCCLALTVHLTQPGLTWERVLMRNVPDKLGLWAHLRAMTWLLIDTGRTRPLWAVTFSRSWAAHKWRNKAGHSGHVSKAAFLSFSSWLWLWCDLSSCLVLLEMTDCNLEL